MISIRFAPLNAALAVSMATSGALTEAFGVRPVLAAWGALTAVVGLAGLAVQSIRRV